MDASLPLYWRAPQPRKGASHPGRHLLNCLFLSHVLDLDELAHCRLVSILLQRSIPSVAQLRDISQSEWDTLAGVHEECGRLIRLHRSLPQARVGLRQQHPEWFV